MNDDDTLSIMADMSNLDSCPPCMPNGAPVEPNEAPEKLHVALAESSKTQKNTKNTVRLEMNCDDHGLFDPVAKLDTNFRGKLSYQRSLVILND